ncbi:hypothetical protein [Fulvivirga sedimenti]|uniref:Uncharacterized protein n=1 Tax=Fulvivirga sedimenti TaxID=2879465 RepID=A0A9X1KZB6_9BACT|nr:hypothetical protein [Fulvivirga sedimenti]MCA6078738.1 hypothetical protein [Fulvivirga sedimenti]
MTDEELQEWLDHNKEFTSEPSEEAKEYQDLFKALDQHRVYELHAGFAHRVTSRLDQRKASDKPLYWAAALGGLGFILIAAIVLLIFGGLPSISLSGSGFNLYIMFGIGIIISALYSILEKRTAARKDISEFN